jgi:hypothetical protein
MVFFCLLPTICIVADIGTVLQKYQQVEQNILALGLLFAYDVASAADDLSGSATHFETGQD